MTFQFKDLSKRLMASAALGLVLASAAQAEIRFWTTETQPARLERQEKMAADFEAASGVKVEVIPVEEKDLGTRATAAFAAGDL
ncbi:MAG: carbohydrate ABC transporter substrate-binding protein, partial [Silicimonas sp.]|nr:carbohydrate ABC transporter substrate-binding protein [Silicimonas sp.]